MEQGGRKRGGTRRGHLTPWRKLLLLLASLSAPVGPRPSTICDMRYAICDMRVLSVAPTWRSALAPDVATLRGTTSIRGSKLQQSRAVLEQEPLAREVEEDAQQSIPGGEHCGERDRRRAWLPRVRRRPSSCHVTGACVSHSFSHGASRCAWRACACGAGAWLSGLGCCNIAVRLSARITGSGS